MLQLERRREQQQLTKKKRRRKETTLKYIVKKTWISLHLLRRNARNVLFEPNEYIHQRFANNVVFLYIELNNDKNDDYNVSKPLPTLRRQSRASANTFALCSASNIYTHYFLKNKTKQNKQTNFELKIEYKKIICRKYFSKKNSFYLFVVHFSKRNNILAILVSLIEKLN